MVECTSPLYIRGCCKFGRVGISEVLLAGYCVMHFVGRRAENNAIHYSAQSIGWSGWDVFLATSFPNTGKKKAADIALKSANGAILENAYRSFCWAGKRPPNHQFRKT